MMTNWFYTQLSWERVEVYQHDRSGVGCSNESFESFHNVRFRILTGSEFVPIEDSFCFKGTKKKEGERMFVDSLAVRVFIHG
jgi:hypothetical protein